MAFEDYGHHPKWPKVADAVIEADRFATYAGPNSSPEAMAILTTMAGPVSIEGAKPGRSIYSSL
jgi:hypothetical protein